VLGTAGSSQPLKCHTSDTLLTTAPAVTLASFKRINCSWHLSPTSVQIALAPDCMYPFSLLQPHPQKTITVVLFGFTLHTAYGSHVPQSRMTGVSASCLELSAKWRATVRQSIRLQSDKRPLKMAPLAVFSTGDGATPCKCSESTGRTNITALYKFYRILYLHFPRLIASCFQ